MIHPETRIQDSTEMAGTNGKNSATATGASRMYELTRNCSRKNWAIQLRRRSRLLVGLALALAFVLVPSWNWERIKAESLSCGINEITFTTSVNSLNSSFKPSISADGTRIAIVSDGDLTLSNADGNPEIFLYDATTNTFAQVTNTIGGNPSSPGNLSPSINNDGTRIAFVSIFDLTGGNADRNLEIFLYDTTTDSFTQVTNTIGSSSLEPAISASGTRIAFRSSRDLTGGNADGNEEIFLYNTTTDSVTQITSTIAGNSANPSINADGTRVAFASRSNLTGGNGDNNFEIFFYNTTTNNITQVTNTNDVVFGNFAPSINADGTSIAFQSRKFPAGNPDENNEIFLYDATTAGITQITFTTTGGNFEPAINADGTRITFVSSSDLTGGNADGNLEIFLYDTTTNSFTQVTNTTGGTNTLPSMNADGTRIAFLSDRFANLGNADGNAEIFLATCLVPQPPSSADLLISQSANKTTVRQGDTLTYTLTVKNLGPDGAANVFVNETISSGTTFVSAQANKGSFTTPPVGQTGTITWNLGNLPKDEQDAAQISVTVILRGKTTITNTATVGSTTSDPNPANNTASITTTVMSGSSNGPKK